MSKPNSASTSSSIPGAPLSFGRFFGCVLLLIGTSIGAGMLALPLSGARINYAACICILLVAWWVMSMTGMYLLDLALALPAQRNHFNSMAKVTLGKPGQIVAWLSSCGLFYTLIAAYLSGNSALLIRGIVQATGHVLPNSTSVVLLAIVFAAIVFFSTRGVELMNRGLMSFKGLMLIIMLAGIMPHIDISRLWPATDPQNGSLIGWSALMAAAPIFLLGFGYHAVIPSMVNYVGPKPKVLRKIIWTGTTISLVIYILWLAVSFGIMPRSGAHSLESLHAQGDHVTQFLSDLQRMVPHAWLRWAIEGFSDVAMVTSCLGVSLGLFDFLADGLRRSNQWRGRCQTLLATFLPPLFVAIWFPHLFYAGLSLGVIFLVILEIILPVLMWWRARKSAGIFVGASLKNSQEINSKKINLAVDTFPAVSAVPSRLSLWSRGCAILVALIGLCCLFADLWSRLL